MTSRGPLTRRALLASGLASGAVAAVMTPLAATAQARGLTGFAAQMRDLTGFDPLPRDLLRALHAALYEAGAAGSVLDGEAFADPVRKRLIKAMYHGILAPAEEDGEAVRLAYGAALQWAAIKDTNAVPSYCGGLPGFWADPPESSG